MLTLTNTFSRKKEAFTPIDPANVRMYVCGPTVYNYAHIGNARPVIVFDILFRLLRHHYGEGAVTYARNITDIDDKIMAKAAEEGVAIDQISMRFRDQYESDMAALGALPPSLTPHATDNLGPMIALTERLVAKGHAYEADGHVLFHVPSMERYGALSGRNREEMVAGARVEVAPYKKDPADFVLWKPSSDDQPGWESPWGRGRPGWHVECSAMIAAHLGETIDIHAGGVDLTFPHHENEIAQSCCAHGGAPLANYWLHNGYITLDREKMSKSLGNVATVNDLLTRFPGEALRLTLLSGHYRQPLDFTEDLVREQKARLDRWYRLIDGVEAGPLPQTVIDALDNDLNTPLSLAELEKLANPVEAPKLKAGAEFMGLLTQTTQEWFQGESDDGPSINEIEASIGHRVAAKKAKDFALADKIRDDLKAQGILLEDGPAGTTWRRAD